MSNQKLLVIIELGGYPDFTTLYTAKGYTVEQVTSMRKALTLLKKNRYDVVVCEFNFQSDFRDRTSSLESMMAVLQRQADTRVVVFYEDEFEHQFQRVRERFPIHAALKFPIDEERLAEVL
ncbi:MAG: hypothetical protein HUJ29_08135 [Gammaproteobacteria bacterium]|nr:hypothetical protein [Gammaproteobacteria bacterium]